MAQAEAAATGFRRKAPKVVAEKKSKKPAVLEVSGNDLDDLDDLMGDSSPKMNGLTNDESDFFRGGGN